jgi:hypothetical protein
MSDQEAIQRLTMVAVFLAVNGFLWYRTNQLKIPFQKKWYPYAVMALTVFFPTWSLVAMALCILSGATMRIRELESKLTSGST